MINKEAITLLKTALKKGKDNLPNTWEINKSLDLLFEQPPASEYPDSEFTKVQRKAAQYAIDAYEQDEEWCPTKTARLLDACDRLDASQAELKSSRVKYDVYKAYAEDKVKNQSQRIKDLEASRKELLAICEWVFAEAEYCAPKDEKIGYYKLSQVSFEKIIAAIKANKQGKAGEERQENEQFN